MLGAVLLRTNQFLCWWVSDHVRERICVGGDLVVSECPGFAWIWGSWCRVCVEDYCVTSLNTKNE